MRRSSIKGWLLAPLLAPIGCGISVEHGGDEAIGSDGSALVSTNALTPNALTSNALTSNALTSNALSPSTMRADALASIQDPGSTGHLSRTFLRYAVSCALSTSQSFRFSWTDSLGTVHDEIYPGLLEIAPTWATGPLTTTGQKMVSACMAGRVNWYGVSVVVSIRSLQDPLHTLVGSAELTDYPRVEGGFWGNFFAATPYARACFNEANAAHSRSLQRDCAAGHVNSDSTLTSCGMLEIVGRCSKYCKGLNGAGQYYPTCNDPIWGKTDFVVTTALP